MKAAIYHAAADTPTADRVVWESDWSHRGSLSAADISRPCFYSLVDGWPLWPPHEAFNGIAHGFLQDSGWSTAGKMETLRRNDVSGCNSCEKITQGCLIRVEETEVDRQIQRPLKRKDSEVLSGGDPHISPCLFKRRGLMGYTSSGCTADAFMTVAFLMSMWNGNDLSSPSPPQLVTPMGFEHATFWFGWHFDGQRVSRASPHAPPAAVWDPSTRAAYQAGQVPAEGSPPSSCHFKT